MLPNLAALLPQKASLLILHGLTLFILLVPLYLLRQHPGHHLTKKALWVNAGAQVLLFIMALGQGPNLFGALYPLALRAASLTGILWIALALFFEAGKQEEQLTQALSLGLAIAALVSFVRWLPLFTSQSFNQTRFQSIWAWLGLVLVLAIPAIVWFRQPRALGKNELIVYAPFGLAWLLSLFTAPASPTPWALLVFSLIGSVLFAWTAGHKAAPVVTVADVAAALAIPATGQAGEEELIPQADPQAAQRSLAKHLATQLNADFCGLVERKINSSEMDLYEPYDLIREEHLPDFTLQSREVPELIKAYETGAPLTSNTPLEAVRDRKSIQETIAFNRLGNLLFYPLALKERQLGLLFLSPYTEREFASADLDRLNGLRNSVETMLRQSENLHLAHSREVKARKEAEQFQHDNVELGMRISAQEANLIDLTHAVDRLRLMGRSDPVRWQNQYDALARQMEILFDAIQADEIDVAHAALLAKQKTPMESAMRRNARHLRALRQTLEGMQTAPEPQQLEEAADEEQAAFVEEMPEILSPSDLVFRTWRERFASKEVDIIEEIDPSLPGALLEKPLLRSVLDQLMSNALAASPVQGSTRVKIFENQQPDLPRMVAIEVTDQGGGLSPWEQEHFLKFSQANGYPTPVGIGDSQALRQAIRTAWDMGGSWEINSEPGKSTTFQLSLPLEQVAC